jgi:hypothetical protein
MGIIFSSPSPQHTDPVIPPPPRHCEEQSDEAISYDSNHRRLLRFARNDGWRWKLAMTGGGAVVMEHWETRGFFILYVLWKNAVTTFTSSQTRVIGCCTPE